jgi:prepilin-type processing-associated H-X9-DG protein
MAGLIDLSLALAINNLTQPAPGGGGWSVDLVNGFNTADSDFTWTPTGGAQTTAYRLREGIERFFITDINNPAGSAQAQSGIAILFDEVETDIQQFNHVPGGANVLYMDGHVQFLTYPGTSPCSRLWAIIVGAL